MEFVHKVSVFELSISWGWYERRMPWRLQLRECHTLSRFSLSPSAAFSALTSITLSRRPKLMRFLWESSSLLLKTHHLLTSPYLPLELPTSTITKGGSGGKKLKLPDEILRGEPPASVGHREVRLGRPLPLRSASESLGGLPSYSPPCLANPKNRAELAASHTCLAIILPLIIPLFLSLPLFSVDEDLSLTKPQGDLFSHSWSNFSDFNFLYTTLSPPSSAEPQWVYVCWVYFARCSSCLRFIWVFKIKWKIKFLVIQLQRIHERKLILTCTSSRNSHYYYTTMTLVWPIFCFKKTYHRTSTDTK